ncbi:MAG: redoxin domain-containing protein [Terracidiphilus sp.]|nr:redoxin domain-containing protein [Terracidiphilus sp.]MDR3777188.1 redoxin domain-containing protein [Terracidiphilus sp.]
MQFTFACRRVCAALRGSLFTLTAALLGAVSLYALPEKGTPAPPLDSLLLLQTSSGIKADWASLKGKVVVLEFWATWCSPCVASLPHLNQLVESLDPKKFQFISIDDEDQKAIETFLTKKKTSGWVGVDASGSVFAWYGIKSRPTTIVVDGNGKIVAVTEIDSVSAADLQAVAEGKNVTFKPTTEILTSSGASPAEAATPPLFAVSLTKVASDAKVSQVNHPPTGTDFLGNDADGLMTNVFNPFENRYVLKGSLPAGRYDLRMHFVDVPDSAISSAVQQAVLSALHLQIQPKTVTRSAYLLRATDASKKLLSPSASTRKVKRGYWHGIYILMNGTMDDLAYVLATGLENPVVNETSIDGTFDARFQVAGGDVDSLNTVLKEKLGLELVPGNQQMPITVLEVSQQEESKPSPSTKAQESKH